MRRPTPLLILFASAVIAAPFNRADQPPNIVIIFADDLGYGDVASPGGTNVLTPHLDRLAAEGRRFTRFHVAQPVCSASRTALLTGAYPNRLGLHGALMPSATTGIAAAETTLAELLRARGYATGMAGKWHLGHHPVFLPTRHGFDEYLGIPYSNDMWPPNGNIGFTFPPLPLIEGERTLRTLDTGADQEGVTAMLTARATAFIERNRERPFFFYLAHPMPHVPLYAGESHRGRTGKGIYADVIAEIDWSVGEVMAALRRHGLADNTLVLFTSDNGPWLTYGAHAGSSGGLREGKQTIWEGGVRVPCILRGPGVPAGTVSDAMWMTIDILPTLARIVGSPLPELPIDGRDVWPLIVGQPGAVNPHDGYALYFGVNELQAVMSADGRWKLVFPHAFNALQTPGADGNRGKLVRTTVPATQLFDLDADPAETTDVSASHPEVVRRLERYAETMRADLGDALAKRPAARARDPGRLPPAG